jgi:hypothetical protein
MGQREKGQKMITAKKITEACKAAERKLPPGSGVIMVIVGSKHDPLSGSCMAVIGNLSIPESAVSLLHAAAGKTAETHRRTLGGIN